MMVQTFGVLASLKEPAMTYEGAICICPTCKKPIAMPGACFLCNLARMSLVDSANSASKKQTLSVKPRTPRS